VLVKIISSGLCHTDLEAQMQHLPIPLPGVFGHEGAGIVVSTGSKVTRVKPNQRIAIDPAVSCGHCDQCKSGREHTCRKLLFLGCPKQLEGCLSEYIVLNERCCFPINEGMTFEQAALSEPLAIGVYAVEKSMLPVLADVAILGAGPIGMSVFHVLRTKNVGNVYITDKIDDRLAFSKKLNPKWTGNPDNTNILKEISKIQPLLLDVVYECSGEPDATRQGIELLKPGGILVIVGIPETDEISFPIHDLRRKEITILNIRRQVHCTQKAIDLLDKRIINMDSMVTHHFKLEETQKAFDLVANYRDGVMKTIISID